MKYGGIQTFKFRTNINERAINFWQRQGARIVGLKGDDYEMELTIKIDNDNGTLRKSTMDK